MNAATSGAKITWEKITPDIADKYLCECKVHNRPMRQRDIVSYAADMKNGRWRGDNVAPIRFDEHNNLVDGQHRLAACIRAGVAFSTWVARNVPAESMTTADTGIKRTYADHLTFRGEKAARTLASTTKLVSLMVFWAARQHSLPHIRLDSVSYPELDALIDEAPEIRDAARWADQTKCESVPLITPSIRGALLHLFRRKDRKMADTFWGELVSGIATNGAPPDSPVHALREKLIALGHHHNAHTYSPCTSALIIKVWNSIRTGKALRKIKIIKGEPFPAVE